MFYGFARFHLRHGVPWQNPAAQGSYQRVTVTFRSVPEPRGQKRVKKAAERHTGKQLRLGEVLDSFCFRGPQSDVAQTAGALKFDLRPDVQKCIDIDSDDSDRELEGQKTLLRR